MNARAFDWILVEGVDADDVRRLLLDYAALDASEQVRRHRATLVRPCPGRVSLRFDPPLSPYRFSNLINWLAHPPERPEKHAARGWISSPGDGIRYAFHPDLSNEDGDTLLGRTSEGEAVELYLPEGSLCRTSKAVAMAPEPPFGDGPASEFALELPDDGAFGNPDLVVTHPPDQDWSLAPAEGSEDPDAGLQFADLVLKAVAYYRAKGATLAEVIGFVDYDQHLRLEEWEANACLVELEKSGRIVRAVDRWVPALGAVDKARKASPAAFDPVRDPTPLYPETGAHTVTLLFRLPHDRHAEPPEEEAFEKLAGHIDESLYRARAGEVLGLDMGPGTVEILLLGFDAETMLASIRKILDEDPRGRTAEIVKGVQDG